MTVDPEALFGLRIRTPRVELRIPTDADIEELLGVARRGVHDPAEMPFETPWTDTPESEFDEQFRSFHHSVRQQWGALAWDAELVTAARDRDGIIVGTQGLAMRGKPPEPETGSWLGLEFQGQGYGAEMRAAVLTFAFDVVGLPFVNSGAFAWNAASLGVSSKLGYVETHRVMKQPRGVPQESIRLRLDRAAYLARRPDIPVEISGFDAVRDAFPVGPVLER